MIAEDKGAEPLMTADDVARYLGYAKATIYQKVSKGEIPHIKVGHAVRFRRTDIDRWLGQKERHGGRKGRA